MSSAAPRPSLWAPSPSATSSSVRSVSRSPESATPGSGSSSRRKPPATRRACTARAKLAAMRPIRLARSLLRQRRLTVRTIGGSASASWARRSPPGRASNSSIGQPACVGVVPERQQQHGLADAAQAGQHDRLERVAGRGPTDDDVPGLDDPVAPGEQRRRRAGTRRVRVDDRVHRSDHSSICGSLALILERRRKSSRVRLRSAAARRHRSSRASSAATPVSCSHSKCDPSGRSVASSTRGSTQLARSTTSTSSRARAISATMSLIRSTRYGSLACEVLLRHPRGADGLALMRAGDPQHPLDAGGAEPIDRLGVAPGRRTRRRRDRRASRAVSRPGSVASRSSHWHEATTATVAPVVATRAHPEVEAVGAVADRVRRHQRDTTADRHVEVGEPHAPRPAHACRWRTAG